MTILGGTIPITHPDLANRIANKAIHGITNSIPNNVDIITPSHQTYIPSSRRTLMAIASRRVASHSLNSLGKYDGNDGKYHGPA